MATSRSKKTHNSEPSEVVSKEPVNLEIDSKDEEPVAAPEAKEPEKIQTDVREKLSKRSEANDPFVPSNPKAIEKAAEEIATQQGFELNRGTSIGARLMARSRKV